MGSFITDRKKKLAQKKPGSTQQQYGNGTDPRPTEVVTEDDEMYDAEETMPEDTVTLDEIFRALREGRPLETVRRERPQVEPAPITEIPQPSTPIEEGISVTRNSYMVQDEISDKGIYNQDDNDTAFAIENVDWRQAVITNEILNKKY